MDDPDEIDRTAQLVVTHLNGNKGHYDTILYQYIRDIQLSGNYHSQEFIQGVLEAQGGFASFPVDEQLFLDSILTLNAHGNSDFKFTLPRQNVEVIFITVVVTSKKFYNKY